MPYDLLLKNATVIDPSHTAIAETETPPLATPF